MKKEDLRIVFFGTPDFAVESLDRLHRGGYNIVGVVTMPDKPAGRGHNMLSSPVKQYAEAHGLPLMQPVRLKDPEFVERLRSLDAQLFIVIAFRMLPEVVWQMPPMGTFNLHGSLLPRYRGAAPINWAIINGEKETGVTTFFLKHEIDTGDVISQVRIGILPEDDLGSVYDKLMHIGADLTIDTVEHILAGDLKPIPQGEMAGGDTPTPAPKIFKDTCKIDWNRPAESIHNLVRGLSPCPAAWTEMINGGTQSTAKIFKTSVTDTDCRASTPGSVNTDGVRLCVATADRWLEIISLQPQGKKRMTASDYLRGARLADAKMM